MTKITSSLTEGFRNQLPKVRAALEAGYALPSSWYSDPVVFEAERAQIFVKEWLYFGHVSSLPDGPCYLTRDIVGFPIIVTRDSEGSLHAFLNMCRHRLHPVAKGCGQATRLACPYHAWTYDMAGELIGVPRSAEVFKRDGRDFPRHKLGLIPMQLQTWGPLLFINIDLGAPSLAEKIGPLVEYNKRFLSDEFSHVGDVSWLAGKTFKAKPRFSGERVMNCNWKTYRDNGNECYHCPIVHPELEQSFKTPDIEWYLGEDFPGWATRIPERPAGGGKPDRGKDHHVQFIWPSFSFFWGGPGYETAPGCYALNTITPIDATRTHARFEVMVPDELSDEQLSGWLDYGTMVARQDTAVSETVQHAHDVGNGPLGYLMPESDYYVRRAAWRVYEAVASADSRFDEVAFDQALSR